MIVSPTSKRFEIICKRYPRMMQNESDRYHGKGTHVRTPIIYIYIYTGGVTVRRALRIHVRWNRYNHFESLWPARDAIDHAWNGSKSTLWLRIYSPYAPRLTGGAPKEYFENEPITICVRPAASLSDPYSRVK